MNRLGSWLSRLLSDQPRQTLAESVVLTFLLAGVC